MPIITNCLALQILQRGPQGCGAWVTTARTFAPTWFPFLNNNVPARYAKKKPAYRKKVLERMLARDKLTFHYAFPAGVNLDDYKDDPEVCTFPIVTRKSF